MRELYPYYSHLDQESVLFGLALGLMVGAGVATWAYLGVIRFERAVRALEAARARGIATAVSTNGGAR